jgi:hypothetical protein
MNDRLKTIVDLEKYPIQDLNSKEFNLKEEEGISSRVKKI